MFSITARDHLSFHQISLIIRCVPSHSSFFINARNSVMANSKLLLVLLVAVAALLVTGRSAWRREEVSIQAVFSVKFVPLH